MGEEVREVVGPETVFCKDHNLIMYPKSAMAVFRGCHYGDTELGISSI